MKKFKFLIPAWIVFPLLITINLIMLIILIIPSERNFSDPLWEIVRTPHSSAVIMRSSVPHGWIVMYKNVARGMVYVPDEKHEWKIK